MHITIVYDYVKTLRQMSLSEQLIIYTKKNFFLRKPVVQNKDTSEIKKYRVLISSYFMQHMQYRKIEEWQLEFMFNELIVVGKEVKISRKFPRSLQALF